MPDQSPTRVPALNDQRDRTIKTLIDHFAADTLSVEEFEKRLDAAHRAVDRGQLEALTADLPALAAEEPAAAPAPATPPLPPPSAVRERQFEVAIMSGVEKKGPWTPARHTHVFAIMGGADIDLREALLPTGVTEIQVVAIMGGVDILVAPGTRVESNGIAILGAFEHAPEPAAVDDPAAPIIRITGFAFMGAVEVHVRYPGETAREARIRRRAERKQLRKHQKRLRGDH